MAGVVAAAPRRLAGPHRQHRLTAIERLDLGLLAHAQDDGMLRRRDIEPDDVTDLDHEVWISRELECLHPVRRKSEGAPDALHA